VRGFNTLRFHGSLDPAIQAHALKSTRSGAHLQKRWAGTTRCGGPAHSAAGCPHAFPALLDHLAAGRAHGLPEQTSGTGRYIVTHLKQKQGRSVCNECAYIRRLGRTTGAQYIS